MTIRATAQAHGSFAAPFDGISGLTQEEREADGPDRVVASIIDARTARILPNDRIAFDLIEVVNAHAESGGNPVFSRLQTTALTPASYGRGQLTVQSHLDQLWRLDPAESDALGLARNELRRMRERGTAALHWCFVAMGTRPKSASAIELSATELENWNDLIRRNAWSALVDRFGKRFERQTGLPARELRFVAQTSLLKRMRGTSILDHELAKLAARIGANAVSYYTKRGDAPENAHGWYARAAMTVIPKHALDALLRRVDKLTTRMRHITSFQRTLWLTALVPSLRGNERALLLGRLVRQLHGAPGLVTKTFTRRDGRRFRSLAAFERRFERMNARRKRSDERFVRLFELVATQSCGGRRTCRYDAA